MRNRYFLIVIIIIQLFISTEKIFSQDSGKSEISEDFGTYQPKTNYPNSFLSDFSGDLTLRYKGRFLEGKDGSDQDFYETLRLNYGNPFDDKISAYLHGSLRQDLEDPSHYFRSIDDSYNKTLRGYLYELYGTINGLGIIDNVKIGRQYLNEVENLHFDGVHLSFKPFENVRFASYAGVPVYFFKSSSDGDWIGGVSTEIKPLKSSTIRFDYLTVSNNNKDLGDNTDNLLIFNVWQTIKPWWNIFGRYSMLDSISRDMQIRSSWNFPSINLDIQFLYYKQAQLLDDFTIDFDEFTPLMGGYEPYDQYTLDMYKGFGKHVSVNFGISIRELKNQSDEKAFNHDFDRYYMTLSISDLPIKGLSFSITGEAYETGGNDVQSLSFDVSKDFNKRFRISLGSYYSLYKFDTSIAPDLFRSDDLSANRFIVNDSLTESKRDNVRTYYIKAKKKIFGNWEISGEYELEKFNSDTFHSIGTKLRLKF